MGSTPDERETRSSFAYPSDRFDRASHGDRVGSHRIHGRPRRLSPFVLGGAILTVLLIVLGIVWVNSVGNSAGANLPAVDAGERPAAVEAVIDPAAPVAILNGTATDSLQFSVEQAITAGAWGQVVFAEYAAERDVQISAVFYNDPTDEPAARGLAAQLGGVSTYQTEDYVDFGVRFVVLLGADYAGPGIAEAQAVAPEVPAEEAVPVEGEAPVDAVVVQ